MLEMKDAEKTAVCLLVDKEEIGSVGATGMQSRFFENALAEVMNGIGQYSDLTMRRCLANSKMLSSDVSSGYDPLYASAFDKKNVEIPPENFLSRHKVKSYMRGQLINWILEVVDVYDLDENTFL
jgi:aspartyl aminopeptidase